MGIAMIFENRFLVFYCYLYPFLIIAVPSCYTSSVMSLVSSRDVFEGPFIAVGRPAEEMLTVRGKRYAISRKRDSVGGSDINILLLKTWLPVSLLSDCMYVFLHLCVYRHT